MFDWLVPGLGPNGLDSADNQPTIKDRADFKQSVTILLYGYRVFFPAKERID
jgi:hypothetical protein